jgi:hypothetical protein
MARLPTRTENIRSQLKKEYHRNLPKKLKIKKTAGNGLKTVLVYFLYYFVY